ncbi:MAG: stage III sporulation protein AF [Blautia sp.]|nr:stage III sporulation protein AF [Blautia sp.]
MTHLFQTICRIGIFMICAQAVVHFRPQEAYEKYLKLLVSAMVLIQLFLPISRFLFHGDGGETAITSQAFLEGLETEMRAAESRAQEADALLEQMTLEEIRRRVEEAQAAQAEAGQETGGAEIGGADTSGTETGGVKTDDAEIGMADDTVQIDQIQVEEIRVQIPGVEVERPEQIAVNGD